MTRINLYRDAVVTNHIWSWPKARSAALTPTSATGMSVGATGATVHGARGVPEPRKSWSDRPPREGVTIRPQEREPGLPLGRVVLRHQLHRRRYARPESARSGSATEAPGPLPSFPLHHRGELGAFSSVSGPPGFSLRPRQRCDWM